MLFTHALRQFAVVCQLPLASHISLTLPLQRAAPGVQTPRQLPLLQTNRHVLPLAHCPLRLHVWGTRPLHCV
jgi:hypothetical protein